MKRLSRRELLLTLGGGAAGAGLAWTFRTGRTGAPAGSPHAPHVVTPAEGYVDHDGWMVTVDDKEKLGTPPGEPSAAPADEPAEAPSDAQPGGR